MIPPGLLITDRVKPSVSITNPTQGSNQTGTITLSSNAADNDQIVGVQFYVDGSPIGAEDTAAPYSVSLNTAPYSTGTHSIYAIARDRLGNTQQSSTVTFTVADQHAPSVSIYSPAANSTVYDTITLGASTSDDVAVSSIQYQIDSVNVGGPVGPGGTVAYDTHNLGVGWHSCTAIARDTSNNTTPTSISFYVNNQPPGGSYVGLGPYEGGGYEYCDFYPNFHPDGKAFSPGAAYMPGNPNPTYYAMQGQLWCARLEDSQTPGTTVYVGLWINQSAPGSGPSVQIGSNPGGNPSGWFGINGGEYVECQRWCGSPDVVPTGEVRVYYRFVPRYAS